MNTLKKYLHALIYAGFSAAYVGTAIGFDKTFFAVTMAALYLALAADCTRHKK